MLLFPVCHWAGGGGVDFGNRDGAPYADQNRLVFAGAEAGVTDGKKGVCAFRFKLKENLAASANIGIYAQRNAGSGVSPPGTNTSDGVFILKFQGQDHRLLLAFTSDFDASPPWDDTAALLMVSNSSFSTKDVWHSVLFSWDVGASALRLYVDDVDELDSTDSFSLDQALWYRGLISTLASGSSGTGPFSFPNASHFPGCFEMFYLNLDSYTDFSSAANRRRFFNNAGAVVDLGATGEGPGLGQPLVYFSGPPGSFINNKGSGGAFVHQGDGSLKVCT